MFRAAIPHESQACFSDKLQENQLSDLTESELDELIVLARREMEGEKDEVVRMWRLVKQLANTLSLNAGFPPHED